MNKKSIQQDKLSGCIDFILMLYISKLNGFPIDDPPRRTQRYSIRVTMVVSLLANKAISAAMFLCTTNSPHT